MKKLLFAFSVLLSFAVEAQVNAVQTIIGSPKYAGTTAQGHVVISSAYNGVRKAYKLRLDSLATLLGVSGGGGSGTVNSGTANRLAYYATTGTAVSQLSAITANRVLLSDANGLPSASSITNTTLGYLDATSSIQTQLNAKVAAITSVDNVLTRFDGTSGAVQGGTGAPTYDDNGNLALGGLTTYPSKLHVVSITEQLRLAYDGSNYFSITTSSAGNVTFALVGTGPNFSFSQMANVNGGIRTNSTSDAANFAVPSAQSTVTTTTAAAHPLGTGTVHYRALFRGSGSSGINTNASYFNVIVAASPATSLASGTHPIFGGLAVMAPTYSAGGATITETATLYIDKAGTIGTNNYAFHIGAGKAMFAPTTTAAAAINLPTGTAPTSPVDGDIWREDNTNTGLKIRVNGVTKTFTLQ